MKFSNVFEKGGQWYISIQREVRLRIHVHIAIMSESTGEDRSGVHEEKLLGLRRERQPLESHAGEYARLGRLGRRYSIGELVVWIPVPNT